MQVRFRNEAGARMKLSEEKQITKFTYASSNLFPFKLQTTKEHEEKKKKKKKELLVCA
jgi:hypothetical protein